MSQLRLIGIAGPKGSGKSTLALAIAERVGNAVIAGFADAVRDVAAATFGMRYESQEAKTALDGWWAARIGTVGTMAPTGRAILQYIGTELFRDHVHPDFWLFVMERRMHLVDPARLATWIIADVRFDNEAKWIADHGGRVICLSREGCGGTDAHASERGVSAEYIDESVHLKTPADTAAVAVRLAGLRGRPQ